VTSGRQRDPLGNARARSGQHDEDAAHTASSAARRHEPPAATDLRRAGRTRTECPLLLRIRHGTRYGAAPVRATRRDDLGAQYRTRPGHLRPPCGAAGRRGWTAAAADRRVCGWLRETPPRCWRGVGGATGCSRARAAGRTPQLGVGAACAVAAAPYASAPERGCFPQQQPQALRSAAAASNPYGQPPTRRTAGGQGVRV